MDNPLNSRQDLEGSSFQPVDPAFRPASPPPSPVSPPGNLPTPEEAGINILDPDILNSFPASNPNASNPLSGPEERQSLNSTSSDMKPRQPSSSVPGSNNFLNLKEFPEFEDPQQSDSEVKRVLTIGGIVLVILFVTAGILYFVSKGRQKNPVSSDTNTKVEETPATSLGETQPTNPATGTTGEGQANVPADTTIHKYVTTKEDESPFLLSEKYFSDVMGRKDVVELSFLDQLNKELDFKKWASQSELVIPDYVSAILKPEYHFVLIPDPDSEIPKAALILNSTFSDFRKTEEVLKRWEKYMTKDLKKFVLIGESYDFTAGLEDSEFVYSNKTRGVRYLNFLKDGSVSLNYIVMRDKIVIANGFNAFEETMNYVKGRSDL